MACVNHPRIASETVEDRGYQAHMYERCLKANTLLILPTGLGKTIIAVRVAAEYLENGKVLMMAPTKPLVDQHCEEFSKLMVDTSITALNGNIPGKKRAKLVSESDVIISTPQTIMNDLDEGRYDLSGFSLVIYDEAHRGRGEYAYAEVARHVVKGTRSVGMTASPGSSIDRIEEVCLNLHLKRIDMRTENDPDVSPFVHDTYINRVTVNLPPEIKDVSALLKVILDRYYSELCSLGLANRNIQPSKGYLLMLGKRFQAMVEEDRNRGMLFKALTLNKTCIQVLEAVSKVESEGMTVLRKYLERIEAESKLEKGGKASLNIVSRPEYAGVKNILSSTRVEHPKVSRVMSLVSQTLNRNPKSKVLVFAQFRDTCEMLVDKISALPEVRVDMLIGQSKGGLKQKEQISLLGEFRRGNVNVLVSTSVGEEGLDVSNTDAVIFYEPVPSEIRTIQRRGRTGRKSDGDVYMLIAAGTVDEAFEQSSIRKETSMRANLEMLSEKLSRGMSLGDGGQTQLDLYDSD